MPSTVRKAATDKRTSPQADSGSLHFIGASMRPVFRDLDIIHYHEVDTHLIRRGDVIVFRSGGPTGRTVHRVAAVTPEGFRTHGDANRSPDKRIVPPAEVLGRVDYIFRNGKRITVHGGFRGHLCSAFQRTKRNAAGTIKAAGRPLLQLLAGIAFWRPFTHSMLKRKIRILNLDNGGEVLLMGDKRIIGRRRSGSAKWDIRPVYNLLLNSEHLSGKKG